MCFCTNKVIEWRIFKNKNIYSDYTTCIYENVLHVTIIVVSPDLHCYTEWVS